MAIAPVNFVTGFGLVPIFAWVEDVAESAEKNAETAPPQPVPAALTEGSSGEAGVAQAGDASRAAGEPAAPKMKLVFLGFQWREQFGIATYPRPDWMAGLAGGSDDPTDPSTKREDRKRDGDASRAQQAALAARHAGDAHIDAGDAKPAETDGQG